MEQKQTNSPEEIDLLYFFRPVSNAFRNLVEAIRRYILVLAINRYLFAAILLLGAIGGYCLRYFIAPAYKTEAIFTSDGIPASYCTTLINNLNELRRPGNIPVLSQQLNIPEEAAWQIQGIIASYSPKDTFVMERRDSSITIFRVTLVLADMKHVEAIQQGLINYLENNEYVSKRKEARIKNLTTQRDELGIRLKSLDSLRLAVNSSVVPRSQGQGIILGEPINPVSIYQAEVAYMKERLLIEERLSTINYIEVLQPFFKLNEKNHPNYDKYLNYAFIASFLLALVVVPLIGKRLKK
ncbi:MAG TPA: hypothetical protein VD996_17345 [Chitinophagaceae bacterium]|nr:hypothetical protein [Chitinophagaceae bacterium]